jgi:DnaJ-class molecular chaperone
LYFHADKQRGKSDAEVQEGYDRMCEVNNAKDILLNETRNQAYDEEGVVEEDEFEEWLERQKSKRHRR